MCSEWVIFGKRMDCGTNLCWTPPETKVTGGVYRTNFDLRSDYDKLFTQKIMNRVGKCLFMKVQNDICGAKWPQMRKNSPCTKSKGRGSRDLA